MNLTLDGQTLQRLRSTTTLKFALLGKTRTTTRRATTLVHSDTGVPSYYELTQDTNGTVTHVECKFAGDKVQTWQWIEGASKGDPKELSLPAATRILGSNDFSHWGLLTRAASCAGQRRCGGADGLSAGRRADPDLSARASVSPRSWTPPGPHTMVGFGSSKERASTFWSTLRAGNWCA